MLPILSPRQVERLFLAYDASEAPAYVARNKAILAVLLDTGVRATELCSLELADVHLTADDAYLFVRMGKGRKQRELPLDRKARQLLARCLHRYHPTAAPAPSTWPRRAGQTEHNGQGTGSGRGTGTGTRTQTVFAAKGGAALTPCGLDQLIERPMTRAASASQGTR